MRTVSLVSVVLLFAVVMAPAHGFAYSNAVELMLGSGSGDFKEPGVNADVSEKEFGLQYTHYFTPLKTGDSPYGERVFLQHPSELSLSIQSISTDVTFMGNMGESDQLLASLSGAFYFPNRRTALGLGIEREEGQDKFKDATGFSGPNYEHSSGAVQLFVHHYVTDSAQVGVSLRSEDYENKSSQPGGTVTDKYEERLWQVYANALLENQVRLSAYLGAGERKYTFPAPTVTNDLSDLGLQAGFYFSKTTGLFLAYETWKEDGTAYKEKGTLTMLTVDHWFSESAHAAVSLASGSSDVTDGGTTGTLDLTLFHLQIGFLF